MKIKKMNKGIFLIIILLLLIFGVGLFLIDYQSTPDFELKNNDVIELEYGQDYKINKMNLINTTNMDKEDKELLEKEIKIKDNFKYNSNNNYLEIGNYKITLIFNEKELVKKVVVKDTTAPTLNTQYISIDLVQGTDLTKYNFKELFTVNDLSPVELSYDLNSINNNVEGKYILNVKAIDSSKNEATKSLTINITKAPNSNQELITETITNPDGTKIIKNSLKEKPKKPVISNPPNKDNTVDKPGIKQSFVANMSISKQTTQAITVVGNGGSYATLTLHTKVNGVWQETLSCPARVGRNGITSNKREGDGKTPSGIYSFGQAFGIAGNPGTSRNWLQVNENHYWVDDVNSVYYNKLVDASKTGIQWASAEHLIRYSTAYRYSIALNYNTACTPGKGSAIFLHCGTGGPTAGCISVSQSNMLRILRSLQSDALIGIYRNSNSLY